MFSVYLNYPCLLRSQMGCVKMVCSDVTHFVNNCTYSSLIAINTHVRKQFSSIQFSILFPSKEHTIKNKITATKMEEMQLKARMPESCCTTRDEKNTKTNAYPP